MQRRYRQKKYHCGEYLEVAIYPVYTHPKKRGKRSGRDVGAVINRPRAINDRPYKLQLHTMRGIIRKTSDCHGCFAASQ